MANGFWLSDAQWAALEPHLPKNQPGKPRVDDRRVISGILHILKTGGRWRDVPPEYGPAKTIYNRFARWARRGVWQRIFAKVAAAGSIPDFWLALMLIFVFYSVFQLAPPPMGRIDFAYLPPPTVTGSLVIDSLLAGDLGAAQSALSHLVLPVLTLGLINAGPILKITQSTMDRALRSDFLAYARMSGLPRRTIIRQAIHVSLPSVITIVSVLFSFAIGGAVLVEIVFSWGGAGQYAVQGVLNSDLNPVLGFVLFSAVLSLLTYLVVDLLYFALDPRTRTST